MSSLKPYTISVPDASIDKLKRKLADADYPDELDTPAQWSYGSPLSDIKRLAKHWETKFSWREAEAQLNKLPNFRQNITVDGFDPLEIHFVWKKNESKRHPTALCPRLARLIHRSHQTSPPPRRR
jgi:hypothetical protein